MSDALWSPFNPAVAQRFRASFAAATSPQRRGRPPIARGESTLILAPPGSGKTLAAFLWSRAVGWPNGWRVQSTSWPAHQRSEPGHHLSQIRAYPSQPERVRRPGRHTFRSRRLIPPSAEGRWAPCRADSRRSIRCCAGSRKRGAFVAPISWPDWAPRNSRSLAPSTSCATREMRATRSRRR